MVERTEHQCGDFLKVKHATLSAPYHFIDSGLPNVYIAGVRYSVCTKCGKQAADIPAVKELMKAIARAIIEKLVPLSAPEIRFLRKRLGMKAVDFAPLIGVTPEQVSRWENNSNLPEKSTDRYIRVCYAVRSGEKLLGDTTREIVEKLPAARADLHDEKIQAAIKNHEWEAEPVCV